MMKTARPLFIYFCLIGIWNSCLYFNISSSPVLTNEKVSSVQATSTTFQAFQKMEWQEDCNDEASQRLAGNMLTISYFLKTAFVKFNIKPQHFNRIRSYFPPLYLQHCVYRI